MMINQYFSKELFKGKTVFITGGGSGINFGIAKNFAAVGANIGICGRTEERLKRAATELESLGANVYYGVADVRDYNALEAVFNACEKTLGSIHTLVCGAAGNFICPADMLSANGFKTVIDIDLLGSFNASKAALEQLQKTKGNILYISAGQAFIPYVAQAHCGAAKAGIDNLMQNLALEWGRHGIRCNSIAPGPIQGTEGMKRLAPGKMNDKMTQTIPLQRMGTSDDIGHSAVFLASPLADYITGTLLVVDGGMNLAGSGLYTQMLMEAMAEEND